MTKANVTVSIIVLAATLLSVVGCGGSGVETGTVEGVVKLDGAPLDRAMVEFQPGNGRGSVGMTDANGRYNLMFTANQEGATPGDHKVMITSAVSASGGEGDQPLVEAREELLPAKYHEKTELTATVTTGSNTIDFDLQSK